MRTTYPAAAQRGRSFPLRNTAARVAFVFGFAAIVLSALPASAETGQALSAAVRANIEAARSSQNSGSFKEALKILKGSVTENLGSADRSSLSDAFTELSLAEYKQRNYGNAAVAVREALRLLPTNRTATDLFLTLKRDKLIPASESLSQAAPSAQGDQEPVATEGDMFTPSPTEAPPEILSSLKRNEELQARLMDKLDASVAELTKTLAASEQPAAAANRELRTSLGAIAKRQTELLEQTKIVAAAGEDRNRAIAELVRAYETRPLFPAWLLPALCVFAGLLMLSMALNAYHLSLTIRGRPSTRIGLDNSQPILGLPAPQDSRSALLLIRSPAALTASPREEIMRYLEAVSDLDRPMNRDARAMQWALLIHDRLDVVLEGGDMSPLTARLGKLVAKRLGLPRLECESIYRYSLIHDLGYLLIEQERLTSACTARAISPEDLTFIHSHIEAGSQFLEELGTRIPPTLFAAARSHHERMDGSGYPEGLSGKQIPLAARIIGVCETYLALQTPRRYRTALDPQGALGVISKIDGEKFDPDVVKALTALTEKDD